MSFKPLYLILPLLICSDFLSGCFPRDSSRIEQKYYYQYREPAELYIQPIIEISPIIVMPPEETSKGEHKFRKDGYYNHKSRLEPNRKDKGSYRNSERNKNTQIEKNFLNKNSTKEIEQ